MQGCTCIAFDNSRQEESLRILLQAHLWQIRVRGATRGQATKTFWTVRINLQGGNGPTIRQYLDMIQVGGPVN